MRLAYDTPTLVICLVSVRKGFGVRHSPVLVNARQPEPQHFRVAFSGGVRYNRCGEDEEFQCTWFPLLDRSQRRAAGLLMASLGVCRPHNSHLRLPPRTESP